MARWMMWAHWECSLEELGILLWIWRQKPCGSVESSWGMITIECWDCRGSVGGRSTIREAAATALGEGAVGKVGRPVQIQDLLRNNWLDVSTGWLWDGRESKVNNAPWMITLLEVYWNQEKLGGVYWIWLLGEVLKEIEEKKIVDFSTSGHCGCYKCKWEARLKTRLICCGGKSRKMERI